MKTDPLRHGYEATDAGKTLIIHIERCTWVKKRIERTGNHLFLGAEHRALQFLKSVKNEP